MRVLIKKTTFVSITIAMVFLVLLFILRERVLLDKYFVYFPDPNLAHTPSNIGLDYEDVYFTTKDGYKLHGWFIPGKNDFTFVWFHGNAGNIGDRLDYIELLHHNVGAGILIFDYRGYGLSDGAPSEPGLHLDGQAAIEFLTAHYYPESSPENIILLGRSLGSAVAIKLASLYEVRALVIEAPFPSISNLAKHNHPYLPEAFFNRMFKARYDSRLAMESLRVPLMVIHGRQDSVVPIKMGRELYESANVPKYFYSVDGADHNDTYIVAGVDYFEQIKSFIERLPTEEKLKMQQY